MPAIWPSEQRLIRTRQDKVNSHSKIDKKKGKSEIAMISLFPFSDDY
jgi:hypothetical protein